MCGIFGVKVEDLVATDVVPSGNEGTFFGGIDPVAIRKLYPSVLCKAAMLVKVVVTASVKDNLAKECGVSGISRVKVEDIAADIVPP